jgi:hypothetical protein
MKTTPQDDLVYATRANAPAQVAGARPPIRFGAVAPAVAGVLSVLFPAIRPSSDESSLQGAQAFAATGWFVAHMLAMRRSPSWS